MSVIDKILSYHAEFVRKQTSLSISDDKSADREFPVLLSLENHLVDSVPGITHDVKTWQHDRSEYETLQDPDGFDEELLELTTPVMMKKAKRFAYKPFLAKCVPIKVHTSTLAGSA